MGKLSHLKQWLLERRSFSTSWFDKGPQAQPKEDEALTQLPDEVSDSLLAAVNDLPTPPCEQDAVLDAVSEAISRWQKNPQRSTASVVVLAHPVSSVARVLSDCLSDHSSGSTDSSLKGALEKTSLTVKLLDWVERPADVKEIKEKIQQKLGWEEDDFPVADGSGYETRAEKDADNHESAQPGSEAAKSSEERSLTLAVIPNLGWCFLRSADGLDGIDYLQELLLDDLHQFWIIGSGKVGWEYLHSTLKLGAYCGETVTMPEMSGEQLEAWLNPIVEQFDIRFSNRAFYERLQDSKGFLRQEVSLEGLGELREQVSQEVSSTVRSSLRSITEEIRGEDDGTDEDENESPKRDYFNRLADISEGVSIVALQLFIKSLRYRKTDEANSEDKPKEEPISDSQKSAPQLIAVLPKLPILPDLDQDELYLLYSLMLHGDLTVRALAKSLGDPPQIVSNQLQVLRSDQVVEQKEGVVKINPIHYPNLRRELLRNNFIIEVD